MKMNAFPCRLGICSVCYKVSRKLYKIMPCLTDVWIVPTEGRRTEQVVQA